MKYLVRRKRKRGEKSELFHVHNSKAPKPKRGQVFAYGTYWDRNYERYIEPWMASPAGGWNAREFLYARKHGWMPPVTLVSPLHEIVKKALDDERRRMDEAYERKHGHDRFENERRVANCMLDFAEDLLGRRTYCYMDTAARDIVADGIRRLVEAACRLSADADYMAGKLACDAINAEAAWNAAAYLDAMGFNLRFLSDETKKHLPEIDGWTLWPTYRWKKTRSGLKRWKPRPGCIPPEMNTHVPMAPRRKRKAA